ncbi:MAG: hypothetical protein U0354_03485 [Candidatus Sericytochromatia bacterium]
MKINFKAITILLPFLLSACPTPQSNDPNKVETNSIKKSGVLNVNVKDGLNLQNISNAQAKIVLSDGTVLTKNTDNSGNAIFDSLIEGNVYNVEITANGYITNSVSTASSNINIKSNSPSNLEVKLYKTLGSFSGKIVSDSEESIDSALIQVGNDFALSDNQGNFKVNISNLSQQKVFVSKIGYQNLSYGSVNFNINDKDKSVGNIKIQSKKEQLSVLFDLSKNPFGSQDLSLLSDFTNSIGELKFKVSYENFLQKKDIENIDVLVIASPSQDYSDTEANKIIDFIKQGKKLIVLGEWGGYSNFRVDSVNKIISQGNLKINPDIVKESISTSTVSDSDNIISTSITPHFITNGVSRLSFYSTASVEITNGGLKSIDSNITKLLAFNSSNGFRIQTYNKGQFGLIGVSTLGLGKVFVSGDSSIFMNTDSNNNKIININESDNKKIIRNILLW